MLFTIGKHKAQWANKIIAKITPKQSKLGVVVLRPAYFRDLAFWLSLVPVNVNSLVLLVFFIYYILRTLKYLV